MENLHPSPPDHPSITRRWGLWVLRIFFVAYFCYLTILLLSPNPYRWVGSSSSFAELLKMLYPIAHIISFSALSALALVAWHPLPRWGICAGLIVYAAATEVLQMLIPPRTAEWQDWFQDLGGIGVGLLLAWMLALGWKVFGPLPAEVAPEIAS
jgi:VanZ family protein